MSDHDEIGTPAWEAAVLRRQAEHLDANGQPDTAASIRRRADELDPPEGPAVVDDMTCPRCRKHPRASGSDPLCAICRASHGDEPVYLVQPMVKVCTACHAEGPATAPVDHRIWCPWVRVTQLVGTAANG